ncbi:MAG: DinG family ATP-dependent helicase YoaA [uncultured Nocardioidaceae bacterium]|uniref:ATP-dependent helicase DinG n=1 Tax=uncultured Nocardioidaceae bacterium TaxID=253824 RepID=A0A6J4MCX0_9ACTN|nr:MAG: DinG family ATP-dependent helicase YoaA [uncultured Nocardioidaceae bacterium]
MSPVSATGTAARTSVGTKKDGGRSPRASVTDVLAGAVEALGGQERPGQVLMAEAVERAMEQGEHLLVQAGTGTGKSLGYLVPALLHEQRVVVATATLALQHQLVERDIPALLQAVEDQLGTQPSYAVLKGRSNYACLHRVREGVPDDQGTLVEAPQGSLGAEVVKLRAWAEQQAEDGGPGDRDSAPRHTDQLWRQISVNHRECLGAAKCRFAAECFAERARDDAHQADLVVTNHSLLAIDAVEGVPMIPEYAVVVVDEAHELSARVTQAATDELSAAEVERAAKRAQRHVASAGTGAGSGAGSEADDLADAADALRDALDACAPGRLDTLPGSLADSLALVRDGARALLSAFPKDATDGDPDAGRTQARGWVQEVFKITERMAAHSESDVLWLAEAERSRRLCVAPLQVQQPLRERLFGAKTIVLTSATLMLGGDFDALASSIGLRPRERVDHSTDASGRDPDTSVEDETLPWRGIDVGSPFDYARQAILYVARGLPAPTRGRSTGTRPDALGPEQIEEIVDLVEAADGRTLGLFSSRRAAEAAAEVLRERLPQLTILAQGDAQLPELTRLFVEDPHTCLFGTLSLWQGLDVPGDTCQLVIIDRIPFPRPDDPLMSARQRAADRAGGNGFMEVSAAHAALLLAQGSGRLIRTTTDRGVVAVLDPRLVTARYGGFLRASLPAMWSTTDRAVALGALRRLAG